MRGLFEKDLRLLSTKKQNILIFCIIILIMAFSVDYTFLIGYGTMLFGIWSIATISYDEFDNGMSFIMTLPITAKDYVKEKFIFSGLFVTAGWIASNLVGVIAGLVKSNLISIGENTAESISTLFIFLAIVSVMIVVELKFGVEKSRTVMMVLAGAVFAIGLLGSRLLPEDQPTIIKSISNASDLIILMCFVVISIIVIIATYLASCRIMENKQY